MPPEQNVLDTDEDAFNAAIDDLLNECAIAHRDHTSPPTSQDALHALHVALKRATELGVWDLVVPQCASPDSVDDVVDAVNDAVDAVGRNPEYSDSRRTAFHARGGKTSLEIHIG